MSVPGEAVSDVKPQRRAMTPTTLASIDAAIADVERLRDGGHVAVGRWTLAQICQHLASVVEFSMRHPRDELIEPTEEQAAAKAGFFAMVFGPTGLPPNTPAPDTFLPAPDAGEGEIDRFIHATRAFDAMHAPALDVGPFGPVAKDEIHKLHLAHAAHHLSFLVPTTRKEAVDA